MRRDPFPAYHRLLEAGVVHHHPELSMSFVVGYGECATVLRDRRFSAAGGQAARPGGVPEPATMLVTDPPEHTRLRLPVARAMHPQRVAATMARLDAFVSVLLDKAAQAGEFDVVSDVAVPSALFSLADLLAIPPSMRRRFRDAALATPAVLDPFAVGDRYTASAAASDLLSSLLEELALERARDPGDDVLSGLVEPGCPLSAPEAVSACVLLVVGGFGPLESFVALAVRNLLTQPEQWRALVDGVVGSERAVEELLRFDPPIPFAARVPEVDVEMSGTSLPAGSPVVALIAAANRDPSVFAAPDTLDVLRVANPHLAFGAGPHLCLGSAVVREAAAVVLRSLAGRFPGLALATPNDERWDESVVPRRLLALPVRAVTQ